MGLSSSQARLLSLTGRMHDIEYKAQHLEAQKLQMANESTQVYKEYENALNSTKIQVKTIGADGSAVFTDAKYSELMDKDYHLTGPDGVMYVTTDIKQNYDKYPIDAYKFALKCMGLNQEVASNIDANYVVEGSRTGYYTNEAFIIENHINTDATLKELNDKMKNYYPESVWTGMSEEARQKEIDTRKEFREYFYKTYGNEVVQYCNQFGFEASQAQLNGVSYTYNKELQNKLNYYIDLHHKIESSGGCSDEYINSSEWLSNMINNGSVLTKLDYSTGEFFDTNVATDTSLQEISDNTELKKAEAKYEADMRKINAKDKKFDTDIASLESERNAISTEVETLKSVVKDNVDRTFKLFS